MVWSGLVLGLGSDEMGVMRGVLEIVVLYICVYGCLLLFTRMSAQLGQRRITVQ